MIALALSYLMIGAGIFAASTSWKLKSPQASILRVLPVLFVSAFFLGLVFPRIGELIAFIGTTVVFIMVMAFLHGTMGRWSGGYIAIILLVTAVCLWRGAWCFLPSTAVVLGATVLCGVKLGMILHWGHKDVLLLSASFFFLSIPFYMIDYQVVSEFIFFNGTLLFVLQLFESSKISKSMKIRKMSARWLR